jgi:hypothetical protein
MTMGVGWRTIGHFAAAALAAWLLAGTAAAEPVFISKQYTRCTSCHISAAGGGLLSEYGRALSAQELSLTGKRPLSSGREHEPSAGEHSFLFGALGDRLGPLQIGIDLRPSHLRTAAPDRTFTRNLLMNADVVAAVQARGWTVYGQIGREPVPAPGIDSYEHWVGYESAGGMGFRAGRFLPAYGVRFADHTAYNRRHLGLGQYDQVYGVEISRSTAGALLQVSVSPGRAEDLTRDGGSAGFNTTARYQVDLGATTALAVSGMYRGGPDGAARDGAAGVAFGIAPARRLSVWTQGDVLAVEGAGDAAFVFVNETAFEAVRGLWLKVSPQLRTGAGAQPRRVRWAYSATFLPRTHWNVNTTIYRDRAGGGPAVTTWLLQLHLYL